MSIVAKIQAKVPNLSTFVVRSTIPLPEGYPYAHNIRCPFTVVDPDGNDLVTQWDPVSWYPNGDVAVAKISAKVTRGSMPLGSVQHFGIQDQSSRTFVAKLNPELLNLALWNNNIRLRVTDVHGNIYEESLSYGPPEDTNERRFSMYELGPTTLTAEMAGYLHAPQGSATASSHFGGLIWWLSARDDASDVLDLTINWHNGAAPLALADLYFEKVELIVPADWRAISEWPEPLMAEAVPQGNETVIPLVVPSNDGKMHILPQRQERVWRLYLHKTGDETAAQEIAKQSSWGVCVDGTNQAGDRFWCWQNPETANYYPQRAAMPDLSHFNAAAELRNEKASQYNELTNGLPWQGNQGAGQMGMWNPAGVDYGGMTGGIEMCQWDGVRLLATGEPDGLLLHRAKHRRYTDRAHAALYNRRGNPVRQDDYLRSNGSAPWRMFNNVFQSRSWPYQHESDDAPWEFDQADLTQVHYVKAQGLDPAYEHVLKVYDPIDLQHEIRRVKDLKVLVWLDNDPVAKKHLAMQAELNRMVFAEYSGGRYKNKLGSVTGNAHQGTDWGRADAWSLDCNVSHYAVSTPQERQRWLPWMNTVYDILRISQMSNGGWLRGYSGKMVSSEPFHGRYSVGRPNELVFATHALRALMKSVYEGVDAGREAVCVDMMRYATTGMWTFYWGWKADGSGPVAGGPWDRVAVGTLNPNDPVWSKHGQHPTEQFDTSGSLYFDGYQVASVLAYALEPVLGTPAEKAVLHVVSVYAGGNDPLTKIQSQGSNMLDSRAHLLALLQSI